MGFLVFAARKLQLKQQINQLGFRQLQLSQEKQTVTQQIQNLQMQQQRAQNSVNIFNSTTGAINSLSNGNMFSTISQAIGNQAANTMQSVFTAQNQVKLSQLNAQDNYLDTQLESIESEVKLLRAEYDNVKKAEADEAQKSAPTFGLA